MTNQSTIDKLIEMRLTAMADAFRIQMDDPTMKEVPFEDRFGMLVDVEYSNRKNNRLKRLIRQAEFEQPGAALQQLITSRSETEQSTDQPPGNLRIHYGIQEHLHYRCHRKWKNLYGLCFLAWRPASTTTQYVMCGFLIYYWTYRLPETAELFQLS